MRKKIFTFTLFLVLLSGLFILNSRLANGQAPCDTPAGANTGIQTALGCIPTKDPTQFVGWLLKFAIGIGGGIAFLLIVFGSIKVLTSAGNPENVRAGQEMITSALMGLLFIIFSLFLLELVGVKFLNIPGLATP
jgi:hypothetical protein